MNVYDPNQKAFRVTGFKSDDPLVGPHTCVKYVLSPLEASQTRARWESEGLRGVRVEEA